ncbi:hypothetical protein GCM10025879_07080 [Leuconostoc litchii]|nr:hypothetical protein GCM10025879_07080 [Leuconostoc litchii]
MQSRKEKHQHEIKNAEAIEQGLDPFSDSGNNSGHKKKIKNIIAFCLFYCPCFL